MRYFIFNFCIKSASLICNNYNNGSKSSAKILKQNLKDQRITQQRNTLFNDIKRAYWKRIFEWGRQMVKGNIVIEV